VEDFNDVARDSLDEWLYYLKNDTIPVSFKAPGLKEARKQLQYDKLSEQDKIDYDHHLKQKLYERSTINTAIRKGEYKGRAEGEAKGLAKGLAKGRTEGRAEGLAEGEAKGRAEGLTEGESKGRAAERTEVQENVVTGSYRAGLPIETISTITGLTPEQITEILKKHKLI
jgi:flagellar biosynthesis/type III secretory pathway protein FliH